MLDHIMIFNRTAMERDAHRDAEAHVHWGVVSVVSSFPAGRGEALSMKKNGRAREEGTVS